MMSKVRLGDVAVERKETCSADKFSHRSVGLEHLTPEEITLSSWAEKADNTFTKVFHKGDVLFGRRRAYLKKAAVAPFDGVCSGDITVIQAIPDKIEPSLLPFVIQNDQLFDYAVENSAGSLSPRVKWNHLKEYQFRLGDMNEQRKLAKALWSVNKTKEAYKRLLYYTDELVKSQFLAQFDGNYPVVRLGDEFRTTSGGTPSSKKQEYYLDGTIPWLTSGEVNQGIIEKTENFITELGMDNSSAKWVPENSVVIAMYGATAGKVGLLKIKSTMNQAVCAVLPNAEFDSYFLYYAIMSQEKWMVSKVAGAAQPNISQTIIKDMRIAKPPLPLQEQFAAFVRQSDKSKFELNQAISELNATYKKILLDNLG